MLGFRGTPEMILKMAQKIEEIFQEFDIQKLKELMEEFIIGERTYEYQVTITDISLGLKKKGVLTKKEFEAEKRKEDFYSFQNK
jgi:hypothetical protein